MAHIGISSRRKRQVRVVTFMGWPRDGGSEPEPEPTTRKWEFSITKPMDMGWTRSPALRGQLGGRLSSEGNNDVVESHGGEKRLIRSAWGREYG